MLKWIEIQHQDADLYGKNARHNGNGDSNLSTIALELEESLRIEEQLRDDEVRTSIHLAAQVCQIFGVARAVGVASRVARHTDREVVSELVTNVAHQVHCVTEAILRRFPVFFVTRNI